MFQTCLCHLFFFSLLNLCYVKIMTLISHYFFSNQIQMKFSKFQVIFSHIWLGFQDSLFHHGACKEITGSMVSYSVRMCCRCFWCVANASHLDQPFGLALRCVHALVLHACCLSQQEGHKLQLQSGPKVVGPPLSFLAPFIRLQY